MASGEPSKKDAKTTKTAPRDTTPAVDRTYLRAANEDDDGYDPYSDRPASPEPLFERDPWA
ncbi:MAG: hypothetical protein II128_04640 [Atopobiaceae bacterium]|jgi:hypothetical protein|nr:hypothetical protein [Atopobiaceae bacterium]